MKTVATFMLSALLASSLLAENFFAVSDEQDLAAAQIELTVQQPAGAGSNPISFDYGEVFCEVACVVTLRRDGTAATTTAATVRNLNTGTPVTAATAFLDSNVGTGTVLHTWDVGIGETLGIDLTGLVLTAAGGTADNLTLETDAITGVARVFIRWMEP